MDTTSIALSHTGSKRKGGKRRSQPLTPEQQARRQLSNQNHAKLVLFLKDEPRSDQWVTSPLLESCGIGPTKSNRYSDPVVEAFSTYAVGGITIAGDGTLRNETLLSNPDFNPSIEFQRFLDRYREKFVVSAENSPDAFAEGFMERLHQQNPRLSPAKALREANQILAPLAASLFSKPPPQKKSAEIILSSSDRADLHTLWQETLAAKYDCSVADLAKEEGCRITFVEWRKIVRTKIPDASDAVVRTVRAAVYDERRTKLNAGRARKIKKQQK